MNFSQFPPFITLVKRGTIVHVSPSSTFDYPSIILSIFHFSLTLAPFGEARLEVGGGRLEGKGVRGEGQEEAFVSSVNTLFRLRGTVQHRTIFHVFVR